MDPNFAVGYRHHRSPLSDRFISVFSPPSSAATPDASSFSAGGDELSEVEVFYTSDFSDESGSGRSGTSDHLFRRSIHQPEKFGVLTALPEDCRKTDVVVQKPTLCSPPPPTSFSRDIPAIPKPQLSSEAKFSQSMPVRRFQQSAPVNVPMMPRKARNTEVAFVDGGDEADEEEVLPPHEMVAQVSLRNQKTTFSVLEGVGRTLKGRDLRQVRNAVWRQTGFLD